MGSYDECKGYPVYTLKIIMLRVGVSGAYRTFSTSRAYHKYFNQRKVTLTKYMVQLSATMEQTNDNYFMLKKRTPPIDYCQLLSEEYTYGTVLKVI